MIHHPLPAEAADRLIAHLSNCPQCKRAMAHRRRYRLCPEGRLMIRETLIERHGE